MPATKTKPRKSAPKKATPKPAAEQSNAEFPAAALLDHLRVTGTGQSRLDAIEQHLVDSPDELNAEDLFLWMREHPDTFLRGTLEKAGYWTYGAGFTMGVIGEEAGETIASLRDENAQLREQLQATQGMCAALRTQVRVRDEKIHVLSAEQRIDSQRTDARASLGKKGKAIGEELIATPEQEEMADYLAATD